MNKFEDLGLSKDTLKAIQEKGFTKPSPIQELVIPRLLEKNTDLIAQAQTGTGKTAAFSLPIIENIKENNKKPKAIILCPTRELAIQVAEEIISLKGSKKIKINSVYGGQDISRQINHIKSGSDIVVGTPGRVMDLLRRKILKIDELEYFVLDEADEMLNMGFQEDIEIILSSTNNNKNMLFFSATMPKAILNIAKKYMKSGFETHKVKTKELTTDLTDQIYYEVRTKDKFEALSRVLDYEPNFYGIVFCKTKRDVDELTSHLNERGYDADCIHGDITQNIREKVLSKFKNKTINVLIATDVAARGIDVNDLTHVINYSLPQEPEAYVHRIGRTGRAGKKGIAITFVTPAESKKLSQIEKVVNKKLTKSHIPSGKDIINSKKEMLHASIDEIIEEKDLVYLDLAKEILEKHSPEEALAALIRDCYDNEFEIDNYKDIKKLVSIDRNDEDEDRVRLFISMGKKDNLTNKQLLEMIYKKAKVPGRKIKKIKILDSFSFLTAPFKDAENIILAFKNENKNGKKLIERAKVSK